MKDLVNDLQRAFSNPENQQHIEQIVDKIIADGNVDAGDKYGKNVLFYAIESGNVEQVNKILAAGADPNKKDLASDSALIFAISSGVSGLDNSIVVTLLKHGADVNAINSNGETPLKLALDLNRKLCIKPLLTHRATISQGYAKFISNADLLSRFDASGESTLIRIVIWGQPKDLQEYLFNNQSLSADALNNALNAIHALKNTDKREPERAAAIQKQLEEFKDLHYPSRLTQLYRSMVSQWQKIKNFFDHLLFKTPEVKFVASESIDTTESFIKRSDMPPVVSEEVVKKDYLGRKRKNLLVRDFDKENNNDQKTRRSNPRE
jgi:hypothetical protein